VYSPPLFKTLTLVFPFLLHLFSPLPNPCHHCLLLSRPRHPAATSPPPCCTIVAAPRLIFLPAPSRLLSPSLLLFPHPVAPTLFLSPLSSCRVDPPLPHLLPRYCAILLSPMFSHYRRALLLPLLPFPVAVAPSPSLHYTAGTAQSPRLSCRPTHKPPTPNPKTLDLFS